MVFIVALLAARLVYLGAFCPYDLAEDEAHYWEWARHLDWSYYSKGPGIALAIKAGTAIAGNTEFGVRLLMPVFAAITMFAGAALARDAANGGTFPLDAARRRRAARVSTYAAASIALAPMLQVVALLSTIDGPYLACWACAAWAAWRALVRGSSSAWVALGVSVAAGFLFKYTMLLFVPGMLLFALLARARLRPSRAWKPLAAVALVLAALGLAPVAVWNSQHEWVTVRHLLGHLGLRGGDVPLANGADGLEWNLLEPIKFLAEQVGMIGPVLILAVLAAVEVLQRRAGIAGLGEDYLGKLFLAACALPILAFYVLVALAKEAEGNWALGAYATLVPLAGWYASDAIAVYRARIAAWLATPPGPDGKRPWAGIMRRRPETAPQMLWHTAVVYGVITAVLGARIDLLSAGLGRVLPLVGVHSSPIPLHRIMGARRLAEKIESVRHELAAATGLEPFVVCQHYGMASLMAFYMPGHPTVYCSSAKLGGRRTQYDMFSHTDLDDPRLLGRPAVILGSQDTDVSAAFGSVDSLGFLPEDPVAERKRRIVLLGRDFRGFAPPSADAGKRP
ncbi:MAG: glycosyltransferase family 39 protein [Phycisphaeraceae bacterium]|nr:glycosyltransferase family 39 protein [Phycisphaeraceae bacterium]